ncbi:MAG: hypothetical protein RQ715_02305 [Methylococcales bacterium]|nr:hypothetical protein [Methylococcales bacterium]
MKKNSLLFLMIGAGILLLVQVKVVMPLMTKAATSDLFLEDTDDPGSQYEIATPATQMAFEQCNRSIKEKLEPEYFVNFNAEPRHSWDYGNYQYLINADIEISSPQSEAQVRRYACKLRYDLGNDTSGLPDPQNWDISAISGIPEL